MRTLLIVQRYRFWSWVRRLAHTRAQRIQDWAVDTLIENAEQPGVREKMIELLKETVMHSAELRDLLGGWRLPP